MLGAKIKQLRTAAGLSLRDVADATGGGLTPGGLSLVEHDLRKPTVGTLQALARALNVRFTITSRGVVVEKIQ